MFDVLLFTAGLNTSLVPMYISEIAPLNLSKFRTVQANLLGIAEETEAKEHAVARARARSASIQPQ